MNLSIVKIPPVKNRVAHGLTHFAPISNISKFLSLLSPLIQDLVANERPNDDGVDVNVDLG
jgi:hypothetical protein